MVSISDSLYIQAFNNGYILAQYEPALLNRLLAPPKEHEYLQALADGRKQHNIDKALESLKEIRRANDQSQEHDYEDE